MHQMKSPPLPANDLASDANDADHSGAGDTEEADETSTGREDVDERPRTRPSQEHTRAAVPADDEDEAQENEEDEDEEDEDMDPEVRRRMEIRARMAKMSGGMGMMGMFGPSAGMPSMSAGPKKQKASGGSERKLSSGEHERSPTAQAPPIPIMALPGMSKVKSPEPIEPTVESEGSEEDTPISRRHDPEDLPDVEDLDKDDAGVTQSPRVSVDRGPPPPLPHDRPVPAPPGQSRPPPPPVPTGQPHPESRPVPPPGRGLMSPDVGEESDDELSVNASRLSLKIPAEEDSQDRDIVNATSPGGAPPVPTRREEARRQSLDYRSPLSPTIPSAAEKRQSRGPPPIPVTSPTLPASRPPPPPPPAAPSRKNTSDSRNSLHAPKLHLDNPSEGEITEYDGDYDTDIASGDKHKDALKAHTRDFSQTDSTVTDDAFTQSPLSPGSPPFTRPPPVPQSSAPRAVPPPPPPSQPPKHARRSSDMPRMPPPPPPPPPKEGSEPEDDEEYDPYRYTAPPQTAATSSRPRVENVTVAATSTHLQDPEERDEDDDYAASPPSSAPPPPPPTERAVPPPPTHPGQAPPHAPPHHAPSSGRKSLEANRALSYSRRSMDTARPAATDQGFIAEDVDLAEPTTWWSAPNTPPPVFQNRRDIRFEIEETPIQNDSGRQLLSKDIYVLFMDYSQTIITVVYDPRNPSDVSTLEQRHEPPPPRLRQDQLENAHARYGAPLSDAVTSKQNTTVGDGSSHGLITALLPPNALPPVGTRAYGALVYANLANASVQQYDEIRAGDIITFRNSRFQGHKGTMHQKYNVEVGKPDHVGVVVDWDGTKKKIRVWEQGRENKKIKVEGFRLGDLRSGEVKVWRVMGKDYVGWESGH